MHFRAYLLIQLNKFPSVVRIRPKTDKKRAQFILVIQIVVNVNRNVSLTNSFFVNFDMRVSLFIQLNFNCIRVIKYRMIARVMNENKK